MAKKPVPAPAVVEGAPPPVGIVGQAVSLTFSIRAVLGPDAVTRKPNVRFKWLFGNERVSCGPIGEGEWKSTPSGDGSTTEWVWSKEWANVGFHEQNCKDLNANPFIHMFLGDTDGAKVHPWSSYVAFDASALLDGDTDINLSLGGSEPGSPLSPTCLSQLHCKLTASKPALTDELRSVLNPLSIVLSKVGGLPGIVLPEGVDPSVRAVVGPDKFGLLRKVCAPVFACYRLFDGDDQPRVVRTASVVQGPSATWNLKSVFLLGSFSPADVQQHFLTSPLKIEVHDRARVGETCKFPLSPSLQSTWEALLTPEPGVRDALSQFDADELVLKEIDAGLVTVGDNNPHGVATVWLSSLLSRSAEKLGLLKQKIAHAEASQAAIASEATKTKSDEKEKRRQARLQALVKMGVIDGSSQPTASAAGDSASSVTTGGLDDKFEPKWTPGSGHDVISMQCSVDVVATKRRIIPKGGSGEIDLSEAERLCNKPGAYSACGTQLKVTATLARPVYDVPPTTQPAPLLFTRAVLLMKYTDDALMKSALAVISEVNTAAVPHAPSLRSYILTDEESDAANRGSLDVLTGFQVVDADWRMVVVEGLVSGAMAMLTRRVGRSFANSDTTKYLYNPEVQFSERAYTKFNICLKDVRLRDPMTAIMKTPGLYDRSRVSQLCFDALYRLTEMRRASRADQLKTLSLFPTTAMLLDVENKYGDTVTLVDMNGSSAVAIAVPVTDADPVAVTSSIEHVDEPMSETKKSRESRHGPMETRNSTFEEMLRARGSKDFVTLNKTKFAGAGDAAFASTVNTLAHSVSEGNLAASSDAPVYMYSGQKLRWTELQKEEMRKRLSKAKQATFTYSSEFNSLTVCMVNEAELSQIEAAEARKKWTTPKGFVYPAPKDPSEYAKHPKALSAARSEELRQQWVDPHERLPEPSLPPGVKQFVTNAKTKAVFGYTDPHSGADQTKDFYKSVHLSGSGAAAEAAAQREREKAAWEAKVVVDNVKFQPYVGPKTLTQLDKVQGILEGPVLKKSLRIVHNAKLPSGKHTAPPVAAPVTITTDPYTPPRDFAASFGAKDTSLFVATDDTGRKKDFQTLVNPIHNRPKLQSLQYKRSIPQLSPVEMTGPKWGTRPGSM